MAGPIETSGDIEIYFHAGGTGGQGKPIFHEITIGDRLGLVFTPNDGGTPPYSLKIWGPGGQVIHDTIVRDLPTGLPQSPPPIEFVVSGKGVYRVEIREMKGRQKGEARVTVS